ncbi:hypothetical protein [Staphylococcus sp. HMSC069E09]|uniref:hypothetical protein n=1 Tax=Staphylococcus sp. HMSC069E09 TaxID=1715063 RepID=UPI0008A92C08|nr:hypothetical protein [Staphylococcus sp. HMSC069E09]OHQ41892.1 hypothetical protein HMPREF2584_04335 [Staphylococcus sp. HMSC069E09]
MKEWVENLFNDLKDVIELEVALHLMIRKREIDSLDIYPSITEFFDYLIFDAEIAIQDKETLHRHYKTANIHNILRVKLKPKDNWEEEKILNPSSLQTIFAIKLKDKNLTNGFLIEKLDIEKLNTTYKRINAKNEQLIEKINKNFKQMKLENKLIPYNDLLDLYKYFMDEIDYYDSDFDCLRSLLYLELDFSFVLYNELLRLTHELKKLVKNINNQKLETLLGEVAMELSNVEFPWIRLKILRASIDNISKYKDIELFVLDINYVIRTTMDEIEKWVNEAILEEEITECVLEDENRIPYLDSIHENRYRKDSLFSYYNLLRSELKLRWLKGRDFNDQDRNRFNRSIKNQPIILWGYNL